MITSAIVVLVVACVVALFLLCGTAIDLTRELERLREEEAE